MSIRIGLIGAGRMGQDGRAATAIGIAATRSLDQGRPVYIKELEAL
jgi:predicted homoserine dehydrogenase-like protein